MEEGSWQLVQLSAIFVCWQVKPSYLLVGQMHKDVDQASDLLYNK